MDTNQSQPYDRQLATLDTDGQPPETRIGNAVKARSIYESARNADLFRTRRRALLKGLVDGNPPYRPGDLKAAGRDNQCNINFRVSEAYLESAVGSFYDLFNEAPTYATIELKGENEDETQRASKVVTDHFDWLLRYEPQFDYTMQVSQGEMVLYGVGPLIFQDGTDWRPYALLATQLKVPEMTRSDTSYWEVACVEMEYLPDELWRKIVDEEVAKEAGWNVERAKTAIINASPFYNKGGVYQTWEYNQQLLKNGSYDQTAAKTISVVHVFYQEFTKEGEEHGKISHCIIVRDFQAQMPDEFMFHKVDRYEDWDECLHPMYYDRGIGGFHHGVNGLGVKMFSVMELQNRIKCNLADKAMSPKMFFKPTTSTQAEEFSIVQFSDYGVSKEGFDLIQTPINGMMEEGLVYDRELTGLMSSNLSSYRTNASEPTQGNPDTATQVKLDASKEASLQKTQMNRYYRQMDGLYCQMYYRAINCPGKSSPGGERAMEFIARCKKDGVTLEQMKKIEFVKATRVVGQGSEFLRQQSTEFLFGTVLPTLPEGGRKNLIQDVISARAGWSAVNRYYPAKDDPSKLPDDQYAWAMSQVADMKVGVPAIPTQSQNPMIFAQTFLQAADQAAGSLQKGANPMEVANFLDLCGQAIAVQLKRMAQDKSRAPQLKAMEQQWKQLGQIHDQLVEQIQQQQQAQQEQQQRMAQEQQAMQSDFALKQQKQDFELKMKADKTAFGMREKAAKTQQSLAIKDVVTAQDIRNKQAQHDADIEQMHHQMRMQAAAKEKE